MRTFIIEFTDSRLDAMTSDDALDFVRTELQEGVLELRGDHIAGVSIREASDRVTLASSPPRLTLVPSTG